jgi:hypothetical protein
VPSPAQARTKALRHRSNAPPSTRMSRLRTAIQTTFWQRRPVAAVEGVRATASVRVTIKDVSLVSLARRPRAYEWSRLLRSLYPAVRGRPLRPTDCNDCTFTWNVDTPETQKGPSLPRNEPRIPGSKAVSPPLPGLHGYLSVAGGFLSLSRRARVVPRMRTVVLALIGASGGPFKKGSMSIFWRRLRPGPYA